MTTRNRFGFITVVIVLSLGSFARNSTYGQGPTADRQCLSADEFCRQIKVRRAIAFPGRVVVRPLSKHAVSTESKRGARPILSIEVEIRNESPKTFRSQISHEWYGGIPPPTEVLISGKLSGRDETHRLTVPAYQVGNLDTSQVVWIWMPGESRKAKIRLNWPGTGSVPSEPLIDSAKPGVYAIRFLLFLKFDDWVFYIESSEFELAIR